MPLSAVSNEMRKLLPYMVFASGIRDGLAVIAGTGDATGLTVSSQWGCASLSAVLADSGTRPVRHDRFGLASFECWSSAGEGDKWSIATLLLFWGRMLSLIIWICLFVSSLINRSG